MINDISTITPVIIFIALCAWLVGRKYTQNRKRAIMLLVLCFVSLSTAGLMYMGFLGDYQTDEKLCYLYGQRINTVGIHEDCLIIDVREITIDNPDCLICAYHHAGVNRTFYFANEHELRKEFDGIRWVTVRWCNVDGHKVIRGVIPAW